MDYEATYGLVRRKAAAYVSEAIGCLQDFLMLVLSPRGDILAFYNEQRLYTTILHVTTDCQRSSNLALAYLSQAPSYDGSVGIKFASDVAWCQSQVSGYVTVLSAAQPLLNRVQRVTQLWLDDNNVQISAANNDALLAIYQSLVAPNGSLPASVLSNLVTSTSWLLIDSTCVMCARVAIALQTHPYIANNQSADDFATTCLLAYEQSLDDALQTTRYSSKMISDDEPVGTRCTLQDEKVNAVMQCCDFYLFLTSFVR